MDREKVIRAVETCFDDWLDRHSNLHPLELDKVKQMKDDAITMLKEQDELIKAMQRDLDLVRSCKVCKNWTECSPDAPPESPEFKMWRDCGGSCKLNWKWRGI